MDNDDDNITRDNDEDVLSGYERLRLRRILRNEARLATLGLLPCKATGLLVSGGADAATEHV